MSRKRGKDLSSAGVVDLRSAISFLESVSCKTIFDCTVPYKMTDRFKRSPFKEVDESKWLK